MMHQYENDSSKSGFKVIHLTQFGRMRYHSSVPNPTM